jgi:hypothetical protein
MSKKYITLEEEEEEEEEEELLWYYDVHAVGHQSTVETLVYNRC